MQVNHKPQITLNNNGIQTAGDQFYPWQQISREEVSSRTTGHAPVVKLKYIAQGAYKEFDITDCAISSVKLTELLRVYRSRYEEV